MNGLDWTPPATWRRIVTVDAHAAGEPFRVVLDGVPEPPGATMLERRRNARRLVDPLRTALMWEPRGHADMYGCLLTRPVSPGADLGVLFLHNEGYSTMCGHGIIALVTVVLSTGMLERKLPETELGIDTPAGLVRAWAQVDGDGRIGPVRFRNVPSFVLALDEPLEVPGAGPVTFDLAFGGAFYAYVRADDFGLECTPGHLPALVDRATAIKRAVAARRMIAHPVDPDLAFLYGVVFVGPPTHDGVHSRNVCVFADGEVDRSPTGTSVSARLAILQARGELRPGQSLVFESILGTRFVGRLVGRERLGDVATVIPEVEGTAHITGRHEFLLDPTDPLQHGFLLR